VIFVSRSDLVDDITVTNFEYQVYSDSLTEAETMTLKLGEFVVVYELQ
jgi:hypothetical protein